MLFVKLLSQNSETWVVKLRIAITNCFIFVAAANAAKPFAILPAKLLHGEIVPYKRIYKAGYVKRSAADKPKAFLVHINKIAVDAFVDLCPKLAAYWCAAIVAMGGVASAELAVQLQRSAYIPELGRNIYRTAELKAVAKVAERAYVGAAAYVQACALVFKDRCYVYFHNYPP